jgi:hypothetical protein
MARNECKTETLNLRVSHNVKEALRRVAEQERRSMANMVEVLVLSHCARQGLLPEVANDLNASADSSEHDKSDLQGS